MKDETLFTPHCPECHSKYFRTFKQSSDPNIREYECRGCGERYLAKDALRIDTFHYGAQ
jgi:hypothetical protein